MMTWKKIVDCPTVEESPYCGLGVGVGAAEVGANSLEDLARDLRAGGGASCCLKLDISKKNMGR